MERLSRQFAEGERGDDYHKSPATRLANMLKKHVLPVIRQTLGAGSRVKSARGGTDRVPGFAQERQRVETTRARQNTKKEIEEQIRMMPAFSHHQSSQDQNFRNPKVQEENICLNLMEEKLIRVRLMPMTSLQTLKLARLIIRCHIKVKSEKSRIKKSIKANC